MPTDKERMDFLERLVATRTVGGIKLERSCDYSEGVVVNPPERVSIFTIISQHQNGATARDVIDIAMEFESGKRNWRKENWSSILS